VLEELLSWIGENVNEMDEWQGVKHYPLLVAHNDFVFDYMLVLSEFERRDMSCSAFVHSMCILPIHYMIAGC